ncbi:MFS transporter [Halioxenophilus sp. WMMB6]|uniref:spinster family MFS transporter n=1 Tax=Halioxenophilus sp. WMMB6 TaxID=3073815 RepID=UPI00295F4DA1|nr:MFS transporter [Halioxenophilus sp. WMMB6]
MNVKHSPASWYLRLVLVLAFLVVLVSLMDRYVVSILLEQIKLDLDLTDTQLGWLVGPAFVITHILSQLPLARIADKYNRRNMIAWAIFLWSLFTAAAGLAKTFGQLFVVRMGVGITEAASSPALASLLSDIFGIRKRGLAMSMLSIGGVAGIGAGMLLGGIIGQAYGWRTALIVAGLPGVCLSLLFWLVIKEPNRGTYGNTVSNLEEQQGILTVLRVLLAKRSFRWLIFGASLSMVTAIGRGAWEPVFLIRIYQLEQAKAGLVYFLISPLPSVLGGIAGGLLIDRLAARDLRWYGWLPAIALIASLPFTCAFLLLPATVTFGAGALPAGLLFSILGSLLGAMLSPALIATAQSLADSSMRAMAHAIWTMAANLVGMGIGPVAAGWLSTIMTPIYGTDAIRYSLLIVTLVALPASLAMIIAARSIRKEAIID